MSLKTCRTNPKLDIDLD